MTAADHPGRPPTLRADQFRQLSEITRLINEGGDFRDVLVRLTEGVCRHSHWAISSVMVMDTDRQLSISTVRFDQFLTASGRRSTMQWDLSSSPVREVVSRGRPLVISDAASQDKYAAFRDDARARGYHTVVLVPLKFPDEEGRAIVLSVLANEVVEVDEVELSFLQCLADLADVAVRRMQALREERAEAERLRAITTNLTSALTTTLDPDHATDLYGSLSRLFPTGWFAIDLTTGQMLCDPADAAPLLRALAHRLPESVVRTAMKADTDLGDQNVRLLVGDETHAALMRPLFIDGSRVGALFLLGAAQLAPNEQIAADAGQLALSTLILRNYMMFRTREQASRRLILRLCQGDLRDLGSLRDEARLLGFELDQPMFLVGLRSPGGAVAGEDAHSFVLRTAQRTLGKAISCRDEGEICLLIRDGEDMRSAKQRELFIQRIRPILPDAIALLSDRIDQLDQVAPAREACAWNLQVAEKMGARGWVDRRNVGSLPSLMAGLSSRVADRFLTDTIAWLTEDGTDKGEAMLQTLEAYLATGRRPQETADLLGIHVSTLRYRIGRLTERAGVDLNDPEECFQLELALRLHRFRTSYR
ncbi:helix-turn-helix domain-containing protein [Salipiger marinus]|uniref:GAF domain-containing protein n=1 Tax=Salipiger marinus TaxID=555512 RepID=A0A1G8TET9_9RHOB|nr:MULTISPECIES: helix-turn-helix domain-containing protein [Salipiger]MEB3421601.1 helix-turn-helix domain-containing protein [Salipiger manganoxidans]SDJ40076.1 GAF domain-containing protein [Salipiger marinus]